MKRLEDVAALFPGLDKVELTSWIEQRWVRPERGEGETWIFHEIDLARVSLIYDLRREMDTPEDTVPMVLSLLDQIYDLRGIVKTLLRALQDQPAEVRTAVLGALRPDDSARLKDL